MIDKTANMPWYKGWKRTFGKDTEQTGFTLYEA